MADIFISYRRADTSVLTEELTRLLQRAGWTVWSAPSLVGGQDHKAIVESELQAAKCVVGLWSKTAGESPDVAAEFDHAHRRGILVPVAVDDSLLPGKYQGKVIVNLKGLKQLRFSKGLPQLLKALYQYLGLPSRYETYEDLFSDFVGQDFVCYKIGNVTIPAKFIAGIPTEPYGPDDITIFDADEVHEDRATYPEELHRVHDKLLEQVAKAYDLNLLELKNNPLPRLDAWVQEPEGSNDERGRLQLWFSRTSYFQIWATNVGVDFPVLPRDEGGLSTIREKFCVPPYEDLSESILANNPGVEIVLISDSPEQTPKRQVILRKRGHKSAGYKGWYQVSASGHMSLGHRDKNGMPSPFCTAIAEVVQEIDYSLVFSPEDYKLIGISLKEQDLHPSFHGYVVTDRPAEELVSAASRDRYEGPKLAVEFTPLAVFKEISSHRWIPQSAMALIAALQAFFPRDEIVAAAKMIPVKGIEDFMLLDNRGHD